ncbi:putative membrane protein [Haloactinopolyspora alba]|uniref:Putative membrane protein n=1 Tax=Haloactinopolyspora alba TaxID=648780 RepID=A0A2P8E028_9ACTN|nr:DUF1269 domain-containing protein [Haloactinopolyspora alba]PSL02822.1 putative membrane protein [Haloactinopolyspora alba]
MSDTQIEVFVATFNEEHEAGAALEHFRAMSHEGSIEMIDAAVVVRGTDGEVTFEETADPSGRKWAKRGTVAGGLIGLIFPPSLLASTAIGAAGGGIWGRIRDKGLQDDDLRAIGDRLEPGTSAIIAVAEDHMIERLSRSVEGYRNVARHAVSSEAAAAIVAADPEGQTPA